MLAPKRFQAQNQPMTLYIYNKPEEGEDVDKAKVKDEEQEKEHLTTHG